MSEAPPAPPATIVVVDDDPHVRRMLERLFRLEGYDVRVAEDGRAALGLIEELHRPVDLLVTDVRMPDMGGEELIATLSNRHVVRNVLFITGLGHLYEPQRKDVVILEKPFPTAALFARVRELLGPAGGKGRHGLE
ncbi:MAG TPA: response regulator [Gemmatimonadales bacterium]|jgi:DNA-binding response OmpR family regulator|nr:response regulator [Gemmatimonadales bacterium]